MRGSSRPPRMRRRSSTEHDLPPGEWGGPSRCLAGMIVAGLAVGDLAAADRWTRSMDAYRDQSPVSVSRCKATYGRHSSPGIGAMCTRWTNAANERGGDHGSMRADRSRRAPTRRFSPAMCRRWRRSQGRLAERRLMRTCSARDRARRQGQALVTLITGFAAGEGHRVAGDPRLAYDLLVELAAGDDAGPSPPGERARRPRCAGVGRSRRSPAAGRVGRPR